MEKKLKFCWEGVCLRTPSKNDIPKLTEIYSQKKHLQHVHMGRWTPEVRAKTFIKWSKEYDPEYINLVIEYNGLVVGEFDIYLASRAKIKIHGNPYVFTIFIDENYTSKHIGEKVMKILKTELMTFLDIYNISALVVPKNKGMQKFMEKQGFKLAKSKVKLNTPPLLLHYFYDKN